MKTVLPDTNVIIDFLDGDRTFGKELSTAERILATPTVVAEFLSGIYATKRDLAKQEAFDAFLDNAAVEFLPHDRETAIYYASIYRHLKSQGTLIPLGDIWIAASAMQHGATILTKDKHFAAIPVLPVVIA